MHSRLTLCFDQQLQNISIQKSRGDNLTFEHRDYFLNPWSYLRLQFGLNLFFLDLILRSLLLSDEMVIVLLFVVPTETCSRVISDLFFFSLSGSCLFVFVDVLILDRGTFYYIRQGVENIEGYAAISRFSIIERRW
jgi:hypothetical protein